MKDFSNTLLVSDVDGTLITYEGNIPDENVKAIDGYIKDGGFFTIATGRGVASARQYINRIKHNCAPIILNGGAIYDFEQNKFLWQQVMPEHSKETIKDILERFPTLGVQVYCGLDLYIINDNELSRNMLRHENIEATYTTFDEVRDKPWNKVLTIAKLEVITELMEYLDKQTLDGFYGIRTQTEYYEIMAKGADKGNALKELSKIYNIDIKNVFAIGDYYNDRALIDAAGYSCYTENAPEDLKPDADYISVHCKDAAVADFLRHLKEKN